MEHLSYLRKLYEYGETLSADELNEIVLYINTSIETINILIDREYAINNGHCEIRYKNSAQQPTKPSTGSNGYSDGWSATYTGPDTEHGEVTWMSICFLNGNGEYGVWSSPVRITWGVVSGGGSGGGSGEAKDGEPGAFKSRVFKRQNTKPARPIGGSYSNPVPPGWYDGIPQGLAIIWSSVCTFYGDGTSSGWSDPAQESDTATLDLEYSPRIECPPPPRGDIPFSNHEAEGWYDPTNSPDFGSYDMIWRAERKVRNGVYDGPWVISSIIGEGGEQGPPGKTGGHHETRYKNHQITSANPVPVKPATGTDGTQNGWAILLPSLTGEELLNGVATFMSQCFVNENGEYGVWTLPMRITGENGKDGEDGDEVEFIYARSVTIWTDPIEYTPYSPQVDDWTGSSVKTINGQTVITVWTDHPEGVTKEIPLEYVCQRNKIDGTWYPYSTPVVWSRWGRNGMDGDGFEYAFARTASNVAPTITNSDDTYLGKTYLDDDYLPMSSVGRCTDDPAGVNRTYPYEWVITRKKTNPDDLGVREWVKYSGTMALWATFTESAVRLDLDNENDSMLYTSSDNLVSAYVVSTGTLFDGLKDVSGLATWGILSRSGCTATINNRTVTVSGMSALNGRVVVSADYNGTTYTAVLTLKKIIDGDKYELIIKPSSISYNRTTDTPATTTLTIEIWRTSVDGTRMKMAPPLGTDGYSTYVLDGTRHLTSSNAASFTYDVDNSECGDITVKIAKGWDSNDYHDWETIPILKADDGLSSFKSTMFVRMNDTPVKPANNKGSFSDPSPSGCVAGRNSDNTLVSWTDGIPAGENILWATSRIFTSNGLSPQNSSWSEPRQMTDTATYDVEFAKRQANDGVPPNPTDANRHGGSSALVWFDPTLDASEDFRHMYWRAEREKKNGEWEDWVVNRINGEKGQSAFKSTMFVRMNNTPTKPAANKGSYSDPSPSGCIAGTNSSGTQVSWLDDIPDGENMLWATSRVFSSDGYDPLDLEWSTPRQMTDTATYDVEFAKRLANDATPPAPTDANRHGGSGPQIWFDPTNDSSEDFKQMYWRAEREKKNGVWGDWVINYIKGEKGDFVNAYLISTNIGTIVFGASETSRTVLIISNSYRLVGTDPTLADATEPIPCYFAMYTRSGSTFTRVGYTTTLSSSWTYNITATPSIEEIQIISSQTVLSGNLYASTPPTTYYCKKEISVTKAIRGNFTSHVFKRTNDMPDTPTGGDYDNPVPSGWSDGIPDGTAIVWMSTRIFSADESLQTNWTRPRKMTDTSDFDVEFSSVAEPSAPSGHPNTNTLWSNNSNSSTIWMATSTYSNGVWSAWHIAKIKGENGILGPQGTSELKQYAISAYSSGSSSGGPADCNESSWSSSQPSPETAKPYVWQRTRTYNPATNSYTDWVYVRLTGESGTGQPGKPGLWYCYAGVWGLDVNSVENTAYIGYYVLYGSTTSGNVTVPNFWMNVKEGGANTNTPSTASNSGWVKMQSDFLYIITKAVFSDYAQLGSFIINGDWFISKFGEICNHSQTLVNPTYVTIGENNYLDKYSGKIPWEWFDPNDPSGTTWVGYGITFAPNLAMDGKTGKVYFNRAYLKGQINATSGYIGDWKIENGNITASSSNCPYISLLLTGTSRHIRMGQPSGTFDTLLYSTNPEGKSITAYGSGTGGIGLQAYASTSGSTGVNVTALSDGSTGVAINKGTNSGRALEVTGGETYINTSKNTIYGDTVFDSGSISFRGSIKTSNFTLPESPTTGTIFFCKGTNLTVTTRGHKITEGSDSSTLVSTYSSHNFELTTFILIFLGSLWALLYSA